MMMDYWDWWVGALALGLITVGFHIFTGRRFGVSGAWDRVMHWNIERAAEQSDRAVEADTAGFEAALRAATEAEFGTMPPSASAEMTAEMTATLTPAAPDSTQPTRESETRLARLPMTSLPLLLGSILIGAFGAAMVNGRFEIRADMGQAFSDIVVDGPLMWPVLFVGGFLVGVGTRMAGGCSSGHGMSGCSRLQPVSVLATSVFFGTAVAVSSLLYWVI